MEFQKIAQNFGSNFSNFSIIRKGIFGRISEKKSLQKCPKKSPEDFIKIFLEYYTKTLGKTSVRFSKGNTKGTHGEVLKRISGGVSEGLLVRISERIPGYFLQNSLLNLWKNHQWNFRRKFRRYFYRGIPIVSPEENFRTNPWTIFSKDLANFQKKKKRKTPIALLK